MSRARRAALAFAVLAATAASALPAAHAGGPPPRRICSLSLAADEILAELVPPDRLACLSTFVDDPRLSNVAGRLPRSIPRLAARLEPVLATRPDLVVAAPWNDPTFLSLLGRTGIPSVVLPEADTFEEIRSAVLVLGERIGEKPRAEALVQGMDGRLRELAARLGAVKDRPRVLSFSHLIVAGRGTTVDALIARAGGRNAAAEIGLDGHQQLSLERILALDPDWLLLGFDPGEDTGRLLDAYPLLRATRAAREGRVLVMAPRQLTAVSPFLVDGAFALARKLHPAAFR